MLKASQSVYRQVSLGKTPLVRFPIWADTVWKECDEKLTQLKQNALPSPQPHQALKVIDHCSDLLCQVLDTASCAINTHGNHQVRQVAESTYLNLYGKVQSINVDQQLYRILAQEESRPSDSDEEAARVARKLLQEFDWEGAGVESEEKREEISRAQTYVRSLEATINGEYRDLDVNRRPLKLAAVEFPNTEQHFQLLSSRSIQHRKELYEQRFSIRDPAIERFVQSRSQLRFARFELAQLLGFDSFAHFTTHKNMANNPQTVETFLMNLATKLKRIVNMKLGTTDRLYEWERRPSTVSSTSIDSFFSLDRCIFGLQCISERVFGLILERKPLNCSWEASTKCEELHVFDTKSPHQLIGILYLDLFSRAGEKSAGAAVYQMRTRRLNRDDPSIALLSCDFPLNSSSVGHFGFRTMMHEFGHALHSLLSETKYQFLSGSRIEMDFMETPSLLMERMSWDKRLIKLLDVKNELNENALIELETKRIEFSVFDIHEQVVSALFDLQVFTERHRSENDLYWEIQEKFGFLRVPMNAKHIRREIGFNHLLGGYAGSFYTYVWSNAIALEIWEKLFAKDPLDREAGRKLRTELLEKGGSREPSEIMQRLIGKKTVNENILLDDLSKV